MGFTCSLLGHARDAPETEREREERGNEVVVVTREVRECTRCGDRTVVSENTEVRPAPEVTEQRDDSPDTTAEEQSPSPGAADTTTEEPPSPDAADTGPDRAPEEDTGVILEDDDSDGREHGEWPASEDTRDDAPADTSIVEAEDGGTATDPDAAESSSAAEAAPSEAVTDITSREWPDEGPTQEPTPEGTGIAAAERAADPGGEEAVFVCPSCEFQEPTRGSSHREGDICPECRQGYLAERTRN